MKQIPRERIAEVMYKKNAKELDNLFESSITNLDRQIIKYLPYPLAQWFLRKIRGYEVRLIMKDMKYGVYKKGQLIKEIVLI